MPRLGPSSSSLAAHSGFSYGGPAPKALRHTTSVKARRYNAHMKLQEKPQSTTRFTLGFAVPVSDLRSGGVGLGQ